MPNLIHWYKYILFTAWNSLFRYIPLCFLTIDSRWCTGCSENDAYLPRLGTSTLLIGSIPSWWVNSSPPSAAYMRWWTGSALVQVMACRLVGAKPSLKPMLVYCQLDHQEQTSMKFESKYKIFHSRKCIWKCRLRYGGHFVQGKMS